MDRESPTPPPIDYRFSLANERTFLAWIRTSVALIAGGLVAAKAIQFHHEALRWVVSVPPLVAGIVLAASALRRWQDYDDAMVAGRSLPIGRVFHAVGVGVAVYGLLVLVALVIDG